MDLDDFSNQVNGYEVSDKLLAPLLASDKRLIALNRLIDRFDQIDLSVLLTYLIDIVNVTALPYLAEQLDALNSEVWRLINQVYEEEAQTVTDDNEIDLNDVIRRRMLKVAIRMKRSKGTRWSLQEMLDLLDRLYGSKSQIDEWFEYAGKEYCFKVHVSTSGMLMHKMFSTWLGMIAEYKNARSHLELFSVTQEQYSAVPSMAIATIYGEVITLYAA